MKKIISTLIAAVLLGLLGYAAWTQRVVILQGISHLTLLQIGSVFLVMLPLYPLSVLAWHQLLLGVGGKLSYKEALAVWMLSNVARLLPGTVWQYVGRVYLSGTHGVSTLQASVSVAYEIATIVVSALLVGFLTLPLWPAALHVPAWLGLLAIGPLCFLWPTTLPFIVRVYGKVRKQELTEIPQLPWGHLIVAVLASMAQFFVSGLAIWLLASAFVPLPALSILVISGMQAFAWLLGYVTIFAPGGVGVADASLAGLLASQFSLAIGSAVALTFRVLLLVSEILVTLVAVSLHPKILADARKGR